MRRAWGCAGLAATVVLLTSPEAAAPQLKASEHASVAQTIDGTTITLEYSRPSLRGREVMTDLFGSQIPWGRSWTPGANWATTLATDKDIHLSGTSVPAGRYSIWMVPDPGAWEVVLDPRDSLFHTTHPGPTEEQIRFEVDPVHQNYSLETLQWSFMAVRRDGADLRMQWGPVSIEMDVEVEPSVVLTYAEEEIAPFVGAYEVEVFQTPMTVEHDYRFDLEHRDGMLQGMMEFGPGASAPIAFAGVADQVFAPAVLVAGEVAEIFPGVFIEFILGEDGHARRFEVRGDDDALWMTGTRTH